MNTSNGPSPAALQVTVVNGNLRFVRQPLLLGHYRAAALTGTELVMDELIGGTMATALALGDYPEQPGSHEVFINTRAARDNPLQLPRPEAVIVVGLGDEGALKAMELARTVSAGVIAWARHLAEATDPVTGPFELAATLVGSGGTGIDAAQAASLVVEGVLAANERLGAAKWPHVDRLHLIELYLDRATEAWRALRMQTRSGQEKFSVDEVIASGDGALRTPVEGGYRGARYDLITAVSNETSGGISYTVDTRRARTEVHAHAMQKPLLRDLVARASNSRKPDRLTGRTLFRLLVPAELEPVLASTTDVVIELDPGTAGIPWEMLDTAPEGAAPSRPWALHTRLLRKLRTRTYRPQVVDSTLRNRVLVIGEPACDPRRYSRLPGAREEAAAVEKCLQDAGLGDAGVMGLYSRERSSAGPSARSVINTLLSDDWRIVHISGHGEPPDNGADGSAGEPRGVVLSDGIYLGAREIASMRVVPELVFVNCCHLAARDTGDLLRQDDFDRPQFAATVAEALIEVGVRCVIAAGWAVNDQAAQVFATTFYQRLVDGRRFIEAVAAARKAAHALGGNTWAAYQCYGDPDWTFVARGNDAPREPASPETAFASVASPTALVLALEAIATNSAFEPAEQRVRNLQHLESRFKERWGEQGAVADAFGQAWAETDRKQAIAWYERALEANDGRASLRAAEQLANLRARMAWESVSDWRPSPDGPVTPEGLEAARATIRNALELLERLADGVQSTSERESLCGSAWKRLALVEAIAGDTRAEEEAIARMRERYARAEDLARHRNGVPVFYPALNCMAAELITGAVAPGGPGFEPARVADVRASLETRAKSDPDFWSVAGLIELRLYEAVARGDLAGVLPALKKDYADLQKRIASEWLWASADDQMHFVLSRYRARASEAERAAADALLGVLHGYAGRNGARPHSGNASTRPATDQPVGNT